MKHHPTSIMPPAILIAWCDVNEAWLASAVIPGADQLIVNATTSDGATPAAALQGLLEKRFCVADDAFVPSGVTIQTRGE